MNVYKTDIINMGTEAGSFLEDGLIILFGDKVPLELENYCYIINTNHIQEEIKTGMTLCIANYEYLITAVGSDVHENLKHLGHVTIQFNGATSADLPGTIYVEKGNTPVIDVGDSITIIKK